jgi:hypothetical protein
MVTLVDAAEPIDQCPALIDQVDPSEFTSLTCWGTKRTERGLQVIECVDWRSESQRQPTYNEYDGQMRSDFCFGFMHLDQPHRTDIALLVGAGW